MAESKVQRVARGRAVQIQKKLIGQCGHELIHVRWSPQTGTARMVKWCEMCQEVTK